MNKDLNKGITEIQYNSLNLPKLMDIKSPVAEARNEYTYSAGGQKLKVVQKWNPNFSTAPVIGSGITVNSLTMAKTTDYVGNIIYENNTLKRILIDGGYYEGGVYYYYISDHLGNNRVVVNASGTVIQKNHYYPFGMSFAENTVAEQGLQPYKYSNKELDQMHGLNLYDYSARYYESAIGRFTTVDPLAEEYYSWSPYVYSYNNPIRFIDPTGEGPIDGIIEMLTNLGSKIDKFLGVNQSSNTQGADKARQDLANLQVGQQRTEQLAAAVNTTGEMLSVGSPLSNTATVIAKSTNGVESTVGEKVFAGLEVVGLAASFIGAGLEGAVKVVNNVKTGTKAVDKVVDVSKASVKETNFVVTPQGEAIPIPKGAVGPTSPNKGTGMVYQGGKGGYGMDSRTTGVRIMDANSNQGKRVNYMNQSGQTVDPKTGKTISNKDPRGHIPLK
ncbi:RHS repeat domain-containing protein [Dysgonomonas reticulitermitis]